MSDNAIELAPGCELATSALQWSFARSGGPGGQNVNKTSTKAVLTVPLHELYAVMPSDAVERLRTVAKRYLTDDDRLVIAADETRSQVTNRQAAVEKLQQLARAAMKRPRRRKKTRPSRRAKERRIQNKKQRGEIKATRKARFKR